MYLRLVAFLLSLSLSLPLWAFLKFKTAFSMTKLTRFVALFSGSATFTFPNNNERAVVKGGRNGLILATDIKQTGSAGHITTFARDTLTNGVMLPVKGNQVPKHKVLNMGPCKGAELV